MSQQVEREALKRKRAQQRRITLLEYTKGQTFNQAEFKQRVAGGKFCIFLSHWHENFVFSCIGYKKN